MRRIFDYVVCDHAAPGADGDLSQTSRKCEPLVLGHASYASNEVPVELALSAAPVDE
jgi:hypothetical protein